MTATIDDFRAYHELCHTIIRDTETRDGNSGLDGLLRTASPHSLEHHRKITDISLTGFSGIVRVLPRYVHSDRIQAIVVACPCCATARPEFRQAGADGLVTIDCGTSKGQGHNDRLPVTAMIVMAPHAATFEVVNGEVYLYASGIHLTMLRQELGSSCPVDLREVDPCNALPHEQQEMP